MPEKPMPEEQFPLVTEEGEVIGKVSRTDAHGNPSYLHPVVHCHVVNEAGELLLQLRGATKSIQPSKWDTSVGGHVMHGETIEDALLREIEEEIGVRVTPSAPRFLYRYVMRNEIESELVYTYTLTNEGPFARQKSELDDLRFWTREAITSTLGSGIFTPNFEDEWNRFTTTGE